jgi:SAM-dependent methyltransferase
MRAELAHLPFAEAREGKAEALPVSDGEVDAIVIGQAFHWFATRPVLQELHRVLRSGGGLGLLWNRWDRKVAWADALKSLTAPYDAQRPQYERGDWKVAFEGQPFFGPLEGETFANRHPLSRDDVIARMASTSSIALLPAAERDALFAKLREVLATHPDTAGRDTLAVPYLTEVWVSRRR